MTGRDPVAASIVLAIVAELAIGGCRQREGPAERWAVPLSHEPGEYVVALIPDTQYYHQNRPDLMMAQFRWLARHAERLNIRFAVHLGDMTNSNTAREWQTISTGMTVLDDVLPYAPMAGNHDGVWRGEIKTAGFNRYFGPGRFAGEDWYGGHYGRGNEASYWTFRGGDDEWLVVVLPYGVADEFLAWANDVVTRHPEHRVIVATHAYLQPDGSTLDLDEEYAVVHPRWNDGETIWNRLIRRHENIELVVCGHVPGHGRSIRMNDAGKPVIQLLANYQGEKRGGNGYLRLLRFRPDKREIEVVALSPGRGMTRTSDEHSFTLEWER